MQGSWFVTCPSLIEWKVTPPKGARVIINNVTGDPGEPGWFRGHASVTVVWDTDPAPPNGFGIFETRVERVDLPVGVFDKRRSTCSRLPLLTMNLAGRVAYDFVESCDAASFDGGRQSCHLRCMEGA